MKVFIEPSDVLFFRDGKPFVAGESHRAESFFPPTPMSLQGAIRSRIIQDNGGRFDSFATDPDQFSELTAMIGKPGMEDFGKLLIQGPFVAKRENGTVNELFPLPQDLVFGRKGEKAFGTVAPMSSFPVETDLDNINLTWFRSGVHLESRAGFLSFNNFKKYFLEMLTPEDAKEVIQEKDIFSHELRPGIRLDVEKRRPETGKLYFGDFIRLHSGYGFSADIEGVKLEKNGWLKLGGESRACWYENINSDTCSCSWQTLLNDNELKDALLVHLQKHKQFKVYFASPAFFERGALPDFINPESCEGNVGETKVKLVGACIGKTLLLGGWDLVKNKPKPMRRFVSAGSVYFFKLLDGSENEAIKAFHGKNISQFGKEIGFGLTFMGVSHV